MKRCIFALLTLALVVSSSCRVMRPISGAHSDMTLHMQYDSICREHVRYVWLKGDTIREIDSVLIYRWRVKHDSVCLIDTLYVPQYYEPKDYQFCKRSAIGLYIGLTLMVLGIILYIAARIMRR